MIIPFDKELSLCLDRAIIAYEQALETGDPVQVKRQAEWKRLIEVRIWGQ